MRTRKIFFGLLSLGGLSATARAAGSPTTLLDTATGSTPGVATTVCSQTDDYLASLPCGAGGACQVPMYQVVAKKGAALVVKAAATVTVTGIGASFEGDAPFSSGQGNFMIVDTTTDQHHTFGVTSWTGTLAPGLAASIDLQGQTLTLTRGHTYLIGYAGAGQLDFTIEYPPALSTATVCLTYAERPMPVTDKLLQVVGTGIIDFAGAPPNGTQAAVPHWTLESSTVATTPLPAFVITGIAGDTDNDGITDDVDNCIDIANADQTDFDHDGVGDVCDDCPYQYNPDQGSCSTAGGGGGGGGAFDDSDSDGIPDSTDNCPTTPNPGQADRDHDGVGDACDGQTAQGGCDAGGGASLPLVGAMIALLLVRRRRAARSE